MRAFVSASIFIEVIGIFSGLVLLAGPQGTALVCVIRAQDSISISALETYVLVHSAVCIKSIQLSVDFFYGIGIKSMVFYIVPVFSFLQPSVFLCDFRLFYLQRTITADLVSNSICFHRSARLHFDSFKIVFDSSDGLDSFKAFSIFPKIIPFAGFFQPVSCQQCSICFCKINMMNFFASVFSLLSFVVYVRKLCYSKCVSDTSQLLMCY